MACHLGNSITVCALALGLMAISPGAAAHVPYIEGVDYPDGEPLRLTNVAQSKAFYGYLDANEIDVFELDVTEPVRIHVSTLIPFCREYAFFDVNFALIGPGLPKPSADIPVEVPSGYGAIVHIAEFANWADRPFMYEMFSDRRYFEGRSYSRQVETTGIYRFVIWHQGGRPGDYVAIVGRAEQFALADMKMSAANLPVIRRKEEMRSACEDQGNFTAWFDDSSGRATE